jgi:hypothetical protein
MTTSMPIVIMLNPMPASVKTAVNSRVDTNQRLLLRFQPLKNEVSSVLNGH